MARSESEFEFSEELLGREFTCITKESGTIVSFTLTQILENNKISQNEIEEEYMVFYKNNTYRRQLFFHIIEDQGNLNKEKTSPLVQDAIEKIRDMKLKKQELFLKERIGKKHY